MSLSTNFKLEQLNPFLPEVIADPYPVYRRYREVEPVHWGISSNPRLSGAWYIFRYQDIVKVLEDRRFGREGQKVRDDIDTAPVPAAYQGFRAMVSKWMVFRDPPDHTRLRSLVNKVFSPKTIENIRPAIYQITDSLLDQVSTKTEMDLVDDFAFPLPVMVIAALLGVDPEDRPMFRDWALALQHASASRLTPSPFVYQQAETATQAFIKYFQDTITQRHQQPRQDLITALIKARDEGDKLSDDEILATCIHLLTAGHETTINLIAKGVLALLRHPEQLQLLRTHPEFIANAIEELIRYDSPVQMVTRWAYEDIEIGDKLIRRGDSVGLILGSANRDPEKFPDPDILNFQRQDYKHCGFGGGIHFCLGSALARAEAQIALNILINRLPELYLVDKTIEWADNIVFHGPKHLRIGLQKQVTNRDNALCLTESQKFLAKTIIYVKDMNTQVSFYRDILDLKIKYPVNLDNYQDQIWVEFATGECTLALHFDPNKQLGKDRPKLVFGVRDIETAHQTLIDRGVKLSPINSRQGNVRVADGFDPEGNPFSICCE